VELLVLILLVALSGLIVGALARLAVPGPDPMSLWRTIALGILGSILGTAVGRLLGFETGSILFSIVGAVLLLIAYRRLVQRRGITGPGARRV
jgi:uncharacterized membrane protein YeaQ/YmgE (transglycosylase-associated protein family)